jgi:hypothetical protein
VCHIFDAEQSGCFAAFGLHHIVAAKQKLHCAPGLATATWFVVGHYNTLSKFRDMFKESAAHFERTST